MLMAPKRLKATDFKFNTRVPRHSPDMIPKNFPKRGRGHGHLTLLIFWAQNAISSKTVKATDFKFDIRVPRDSPDMTPKFSQKSAWPRSRDPLNFWALNADSSKTVKATDFKFDTRVPRHSPDMTSKNFPNR